MGTLDATFDAFAAPIAALYAEVPEYLGPDFPEGFWIEEFDPVKGYATTTRLIGNFMPLQPFTSVMKHKVAQEYYSGNPEPAVQMLGARHEPQVIRGHWSAKKFSATPTPESPDNMRLVPGALRDHFEGIVERGNLLKLSLGSWERWGFLTSVTFNLKTLASIDYEMEFIICGKEKPVNCKIVSDTPTLPDAENAALLEAAEAWQESLLDKPKTFPGTLWDEINSGIGEVATVLAVVTKTVDGVLAQAEQAQKAASKVMGLVKYAKAKISAWKFQVSKLNAYLANPTQGAFDTPFATAQMMNQKYIQKCLLSTSKPTYKMGAGASVITTPTAAAQGPVSTKPSMEALLNAIEAKFKKMASFVPKAKHLVKNGDTLQTLSVKYYGTADNWNKIYSHNKLTDTALVVGTVLEIPNV